jgi:hypothetical protein
MKLKNILTIFLIVICINLISCSDDTDNIKVEYRVYSNTKGALVRLAGPEIVTIKDYWEYHHIGSTGETAQVDARCDDLTVLITCEIYLNGKLKSKMNGNGFATASVRY